MKNEIVEKKEAENKPCKNFYLQTIGNFICTESRQNNIHTNPSLSPNTPPCPLFHHQIETEVANLQYIHIKT